MALLFHPKKCVNIYKCEGAFLKSFSSKIGEVFFIKVLKTIEKTLKSLEKF